MAELDYNMIVYGNKNILAQPYIADREYFIMKMISVLQQTKHFLQKDDVVCFNPIDDGERKYLIDKIDDCCTEAKDLLK